MRVDLVGGSSPAVNAVTSVLEWMNVPQSQLTRRIIQMSHLHCKYKY